MDQPYGGRTAVFSSNGNSAFLIDKQKRLLAYGGNNYGQLGIGRSGVVSEFVEVKGLNGKEILMVSSGQSHTLILTKDDHMVYGCGHNSRYQFGYNVHPGYQPEMLPFFSDKDIVQVRTGASSSYCMSSDGSLYSLGDNGIGQLGVRSSSGYNSSPVLVKLSGGFKIEKISAGWQHMATLGSDGQVYTCGDNQFGQLGRDGDHNFPAKVEGLEGKRAKEVMCGHYSTFVVVEKDEIYSFGRNNKGSLGIGNTSNQSRPQRITFFDTHPIRVLSVGGNHSFAILENGYIYSFGANSSGQLFLGDTSIRSTPTKVDVIIEGGVIVDIRCFSDYTLLVTDKGSCYVLGIVDDTRGVIVEPKKIGDGVVIPIDLQPEAPPHAGSSQQRILEYILEENLSETVTGIADYTIEVKNKISEITEIHLDRDFLRLRCPHLNIAADERSRQVSLESFFTPIMKETLIVALYMGKIEIVQSLKLEEMVGLHRFLTKCPLSEKLKVATESYIRKRVDKSLKTALDVIIEAFEVGNEELADYPLVVIASNYLEAAPLIYEAKDELPNDFNTLIMHRKPKEIPLQDVNGIEEPNLKVVLPILYREAMKGDSGRVTIECGDESWKAHKFVLFARIPLFRRRLLKETSESMSVWIPQELKSSFPMYLHFVYTGAVSLEPIESLKILPSVEHFSFKRKKTKVDEFDAEMLNFCKDNSCRIVIKVDNCIELIKIANERQLNELKERAVQYAAVHQDDLKEGIRTLELEDQVDILNRTIVFLRKLIPANTKN